MKDFQSVIDGPQQIAPKLVLQPKVELPLYRKTIELILPYASPLLLSIVTGPFTTVSILLQMTSKPLSSPLASKIATQPHLQRHISNGIFGDNKIFEPPTNSGYKEAFKKLGKQGFRGLYKGNLSGVLLASSNSWLRGRIYKEVGQAGLLKQGLTTNLLTIAICTLTDFVTLPLMTAQSRLVLQNSSPNFRTYKSALSVWRSAPKQILSGGSVLLLKNTLFELSWIKFMPASPAYSFMLSTVLSHLITYPFLTVMRQLQTSDPTAPMMFNRSENVREVLKRLWSQGKVKSFYRGFLAYSGVHFFMGALMIQANIRSGFFVE